MSVARFTAPLIALALAVSFPAMAEAKYKKVNSKDEFVQITNGKNMTIMGITVFVTADGKIGGKAYGRQVKGAWRWQDGFFCRDLYWGERDFGPNCQEVRVHGDKIRFASDRGAGRSAVLTLR